MGYVLVAAALLQTETFQIHPWVTWVARFITAFAGLAGIDIAWDALHERPPAEPDAWDDGTRSPTRLAHPIPQGLSSIPHELSGNPSQIPLDIPDPPPRP
jgi:hypothetical protein